MAGYRTTYQLGRPKQDIISTCDQGSGRCPLAPRWGSRFPMVVVVGSSLCDWAYAYLPTCLSSLPRLGTLTGSSSGPDGPNERVGRHRGGKDRDYYRDILVLGRELSSLGSVRFGRHLGHAPVTLLVMTTDVLATAL
ncbi:hypothetical protein NDU88_000465 [Pleurodeles waltl]|uniref:Uncharacterized protein n=1 Tax=Pleurodeles waltl TaxID=8319 RepID=A0AAV7S5C7_PLEWA|nr:hypothetical protein NDU88_000465 [Pleurodeles waltl]